MIKKARAVTVKNSQYQEVCVQTSQAALRCTIMLIKPPAQNQAIPHLLFRVDSTVFTYHD